MNPIKLSEHLTIESVDNVWPDELELTVKFKVTLDNVPYSLHMQSTEEETYFTDAPFYGYKRDYKDIYNLLNANDFKALLSACRSIYEELKGKWQPRVFK